MKYCTLIFSLVLLASLEAVAAGTLTADERKQSQVITQAGSQASFTKSAENFTGNARVDPLFSATDAAPFSGAYVTFEPGARSAWHVHPAGQRLLVTAGVGRTGEWGGPVEEIMGGDVIWCPPAIKHWHGASPTAAMTHIAITGSVNGKNVEWLEKVGDEQYDGKPGGAANSMAQPVDTNQALSSRQQGVVAMAAFTARGDLEKLKVSLNEGLDAGLTVNEVKEVLVHLYAYTGFPRSLNALNAFMGVMEERQKKGIKDEAGSEASPLPANTSAIKLGTDIQTRLVGKPVSGAVYTFAPAIDQFLKGHLFGDIFGRDNLDFQSREIATISALAGMDGVDLQLQAHLNVSLNVGLTEAQLRQVVSVLESKVGKDKAAGAARLLDEVLKIRKASSGR